MAHNGAKAGFVTTPAHSSASLLRFWRFIFLSLLVSVVAVSYYCWTTTVNNSMLQDRVNRLSVDFSLIRSQRTAAEKNIIELKNRLTQLQSSNDGISQQLKQAKDELIEMRSKQEAEKRASASCEQRLTLLKQQHGDDMKAVTHEVSDCQTKLETAKADRIKYGRLQQLTVLRAIYELTSNRVLNALRDKYNIDITGVENDVNLPRTRFGQRAANEPGRGWRQPSEPDQETRRNRAVELEPQQQARASSLVEHIRAQRLGQNLDQQFGGRPSRRQAGVGPGWLYSPPVRRFSPPLERHAEQTTTQSAREQPGKEDAEKLQPGKKQSEVMPENKTEEGESRLKEAVDASNKTEDRPAGEKNVIEKTPGKKSSTNDAADDEGADDGTEKEREYEEDDKEVRGKEGVAGSPGASVGKAQAPAAQEKDIDEEYEVDKDRDQTGQK